MNTYTTSGQRRPSAAFDPTGNFVVVWDSYLQDGSGFGVFAQAYDNLGNPLGSEFQVNQQTSGHQAGPRVASLGNLEMVVVWSGQDGSGAGVFGRKVHVFGGVVGPEFQVNTYTTSQQSGPSVASDAVGFVVVWGSDGQDGSYQGVFARQHNSDGNPRGAEFRVNSSTSGSQRYPDVAGLDASGNFIVVWTGQDAFWDGIFGQRYNALGAPFGAEFPINTYTPYAQHSPSVAAAANGSFVVVWEDYLEDYPQYQFTVRGRRYDAAGAALGADFVVNSYTTWWARLPQVSSDTAGNSVVVWEAVGGGAGETWDGRGRRYDALGSPGYIRLNAYTTSNQQDVAVASKPGGDFVAVWMSESQDGDGLSVYGRRFAADPDLIFRDDLRRTTWPPGPLPRPTAGTSARPAWPG